MTEERCETVLFSAVGEQGWQTWRCREPKGPHPVCELYKEGDLIAVLKPSPGRSLRVVENRAVCPIELTEFNEAGDTPVT